MIDQHEKLSDVYYELRDLIDLRISNYINHADLETRDTLKQLRRDVRQDISQVWELVLAK
ncbi:hypothetical protein JW859_15015 [bacterium]|nr:hypothetical protein [bacterium]